ncbi:MAG: ATP-binding protein [Bacteroidota bacterium]
MPKLLGLALVLSLSFPSLTAQNYRDSTILIFDTYFGEVTDSLAQQHALATEVLTDLIPHPHDTLTLASLYALSTKLQGDPSREFYKLLIRMAERGATGALDQAIIPTYQEMLVKALFGFYVMEGDLKYVYRALTWAQEMKHNEFIAECYSYIGVSFFNQQDFPAAAEAWLKVQELDPTSLSPSLLARTAYYLGVVYQKQKNSKEATIQFQRSLEISQQMDDSLGIARSYKGMAFLQLQTGDTLSAHRNLEQAMTIYRKNNVLISQFSLLYDLGKLAEKRGDWAELARYADELTHLLEVVHEPTDVMLKEAYGILLAHYKHQGNYRKALEIQKKQINAILRINDERNLQEIYDQKYQFEYRQKALTDSLQTASQLTLKEEESRRRQSMSYFLLGGLTLTLIFGLILLNRFRLTQKQKGMIEAEKGKLDIANAELNVANSELNLANEKLQELNAFKSRFFTNISHEFRTPLTVIGGMAEQIREHPDKWAEKGSTLIKRNTRGLLTLVNQILDLRKLESGNLQLSPQKAEVIRFLRLGVASFESMAEMKQIDLRLESEIESLYMDFDAEKLSLVQNNLLSNALKFTSEGGKVICKVRQQEGQLELQVSDTGIGIPAEKLPLVFGRFYQVDSSSTRQGEGTGIGLSLTKELVELMGGRIEVQSELGKGSVFTLNLPISLNAPPATEPLVLEKKSVDIPLPFVAPPTTVVPARQELPSLLIIEDNADIVAYLHACLEDQYELFAAPDGQAGIEMALELVPDLIITDVMMPHKNGYEVCETLKLDERTSHIPIVMLTAKADQPSRLEGYKRGADAYLSKPFDQAELGIRLEKLLELRKVLQARYQQKGMPPKSDDLAMAGEDAFIMKIRQLIRENLDDSTYRGEALGKDLGLGKSHLHRKTKALTGMPVSHFIRKLRIEFAQEFLTDPQLQINEVAYMVGFNDPAYFSRIFQDLMGVSPRKWKTQLKE